MDKVHRLNFNLSDLPDLHIKGVAKRKHLELPLLYKVRELDCLEYEGLNVVEGDILLSPPEMQAEPVVSSWKNLWGTLGHTVPTQTDESHDYRWPDGVITYTSQGSIEQLVLNAIAHWESLTPFKFIHLTQSDSLDYVSFVASDQNASYIGRQGQKQIVKLVATTEPKKAGWAIHEIGHVIGLYHEHCRIDRDQYISINLENIRNEIYKVQFQPISENAELIGSYDYQSQMHYPEDAFAINGSKTIVRKDGEALGERCGLSLGDIAACKALYPELDW